MDSDGKNILSVCKYVPSIMALTHIETKKYNKINEAHHKVNGAENICQICA